MPSVTVLYRAAGLGAICYLHEEPGSRRDLDCRAKHDRGTRAPLIRITSGDRILRDRGGSAELWPGVSPLPQSLLIVGDSSNHVEPIWLVLGAASSRGHYQPLGS
jgi:hypothetical protein